MKREPPQSDAARGKANARSLAGSYLRRGILFPGYCIECGSEKVQMHHEDYTMPLEVTWMCVWCHKSHHRMENNEARPGPRKRTPLEQALHRSEARSLRRVAQARREILEETSL